MNTKHTLEQLKELKLNGMAGCYETQLNQPVQKQADAHTLIAMMAEAEATAYSGRYCTNRPEANCTGATGPN